MVQANFITKSGLKVNLEGTPGEIANLIEDFERKNNRIEERKAFLEQMLIRRRERNEFVHNRSASGQGLTQVLLKFLEEGFFDETKNIRIIMSRLSHEGIHPPSSTVHPLLGRLVLKDKLKRTRGESGNWEYQKR